MRNYRFRLRVFICSFLAMIAVLFVVGCLIIQVFNSSTIFPKSYDLGEGDIRLITVSTTFCEGISLHASKLPQTLTVVDEVRTVKKARVSNVTLEVFIPPHKYWSKAFYLLKGSQIRVEAKSESFFQLLIFKGKSNFDGWIGKQKLDYKSNTNTKGKDKRTLISYVYNVSQDENYYILFKRISVLPRVIELLVNLSVSRRIYDVSNPVLRCDAAAGKPCEARLLFNSKEKTIVEVSSRSSEYLYINNFPSTWNCQPRIWFFIVIFGGGYIACITCTLVIYILLMNTKADHLKSKVRKQSIKSQSSFSGSYRDRGGSTRKKRVSLEMSSHTLPSRCSSRAGSQSKRPASCANGSLKRKYETVLPSVIPHIYKGDSSESDHDENENDLESFHQLRRVPSMENISLASFDTTVSLPVTFSSFNRRNVDADSVSCHSFRHDANHHRFRHRDRHHPRFHQELKLEREGLREEAQRAKLISHQSDSQLSRARTMTLPSRLPREINTGRDFYRDLEKAARTESERVLVHSANNTPTSGRKTLPGNTAQRDYLPLDFDFARKANYPRRHSSDSQLDRRVQTLHARGRRDFYRDLELARRRDANHNYKRLKSDEESCHLMDSDYELEFERAIERHDNKRLISRGHHVQPLEDPDDSDQVSVGDQLDRIADAEDNKKRPSSKSRLYGNGCPPQMEPLLKATPIREHENHLVVLEAEAMPDGKIINKKKSKKDLNKKDVKLRNHSSRHKERFWRPRLSIVSEV